MRYGQYETIIAIARRSIGLIARTPTSGYGHGPWRGRILRRGSVIDDDDDDMQIQVVFRRRPARRARLRGLPPGLRLRVFSSGNELGESLTL
jgi:hypothetical protein